MFALLAASFSSASSFIAYFMNITNKFNCSSDGINFEMDFIVNSFHNDSLIHFVSIVEHFRRFTPPAKYRTQNETQTCGG